MAYAVTALTSGNDNVDRASYNTLFVSPTAGRRPVIAFLSRMGGGVTPNLGTVSGNGLTWTYLKDVTFASGAQRWRLAAYIGSGTPSPGVVTIAYAGQTQLECVWSVCEVADAPIVVQTPVSATGTSNAPIANLAAFADANNLTLGVLGALGTGAAAIVATAGSGFTQIHHLYNAPSFNDLLFTEKKATADTSVDASLSESIVWGMLAVELGALPPPNDGSGTITAEADLTGAASVAREGSGSITAEADLSGVGDTEREGSGSIAAVSSLTGQGAAEHSGSGAVSAVGSLTGNGSTAHEGSGAVSAVGSLSGEGSTDASGSGSVTALAGLTGQGETAHEGSGTLDADAGLTGDGSTAREGSGSISAVGSLTGAGSDAQGGSGTVSALAGLVGDGSSDHAGAATVSAVGSLSGEGATDHEGSGSVTAEGSLAGDGSEPSTAPNTGSGSFGAVASLDAEGYRTSEGAGVVTGTATLTADGRIVTTGSGVISAVATLTGAGVRRNVRISLGTPASRWTLGAPSASPVAVGVSGRWQVGPPEQE
jgi:hypothetical protein